MENDLTVTDLMEEMAPDSVECRKKDSCNGTVLNPSGLD